MERGMKFVKPGFSRKVGAWSGPCGGIFIRENPWRRFRDPAGGLHGQMRCQSIDSGHGGGEAKIGKPGPGEAPGGRDGFKGRRPELQRAPPSA